MSTLLGKNTARAKPVTIVNKEREQKLEYELEMMKKEKLEMQQQLKAANQDVAALRKRLENLEDSSPTVSVRDDFVEINTIKKHREMIVGMLGEYDKMIDSEFADMKNIGGREAGSTTAAQFLQRFVNNVPWVHLDVAGTAMASPATDFNQSWGSGFGVRLLDRWARDTYES